MWADQYPQGGRGVHPTVPQPGPLLQGTVCHLFITGCTEPTWTLYGEEEDQNRGKVHQVDSQGLEQAGEMVV